MIRNPEVNDFYALYAYYKEKTIQEKTFVLIEPSTFDSIISQGFLALFENQLGISGFILSHMTNHQSYITMLYGETLDIKNSLMEFYDSKMIEKGITESWIHFFNPISLAWYPVTDIIHPCYQGVPIDSEMHHFYQENHYIEHSIQDTYYLDLSTFEMPSSVNNQIKMNISDGFEIALYNPRKHLKLIEFTDKINAPHWKSIILENLNRSNPLPLLVALKNNQVIGFTGPLKVEKHQRGYFAGIGILETERGKKIGKTLFFMLCQTLKTMGSSYMTLFTGRDNPAKYIYLSAQFEVVKSFYTMKKMYK